MQLKEAIMIPLKNIIKPAQRSKQKWTPLRKKLICIQILTLLSKPRPQENKLLRMS
jgi:hypothetical protein